MALPNTLHQIWIGPKQRPAWMHGWSCLDTWDYILWDDDRINKLLELDYPKLHALYQRYLKDGCYNGASNIARVAILKDYGGVYIDADTEFVSDFVDEDFMQADAFMVHSPNVDPVDEHTPTRLANGIMGATKGHPFLASYIRALEKVDVDHLHPSWKRTGSGLMTTVFNRRRTKGDIPILAAHTFLPYNLKRKQVGPVTYGIHRYGTTRNLYKG